MRKRKARMPHGPVSPTSETKPTALVKLVTNGQPASVEGIQRRAYLKWEVAGKPAGSGVKFWLEAERELSPAK
jgi:hypothetical protein